MYKYMEFYLTRDLIDFLNENKIPRENVIKIGMIYNVWTLVYYTEEPDTETAKDALDNMKTDIEKMFGSTESKDGECKNCYFNDGKLHAECVLCDKSERVLYDKAEREE